MSDPFAFSKASAGPRKGQASGTSSSSSSLGVASVEAWHPTSQPSAASAPDTAFGHGTMQQLPAAPRGFAAQASAAHPAFQPAFQPAAPLAPPSFSALTQDPMAQMMAQGGMAYGEKLLEGGIARGMPGVASALASLRTYFAVNNTYVLRKLAVRAAACQQWQQKGMWHPPQFTPPPTHTLPHCAAAALPL